MFPLAHHYVNKRLYGQVPSLMILGGLWPDLAAGVGIDRDSAHQVGLSLLNWCRTNTPDAEDFARGIITHGTSPQGVDWYADEAWPGCCRGWCFLQAAKYLPQIAVVTGLPGDTILPDISENADPPRNQVWWKGHNLIEIACEMEVYKRMPQLGEEIIAAIEDTTALDKALSLLQQYYDIDRNLIRPLYECVPKSYSLINVTALDQAKKQQPAMSKRFKEFNLDVPGLANLLEQIHSDLKQDWPIFIEELVKNLLPLAKL